jgi:DNA-binding NarL/FixJ family response regulator
MIGLGNGPHPVYEMQRGQKPKPIHSTVDYWQRKQLWWYVVSVKLAVVQFRHEGLSLQRASLAALCLVNFMGNLHRVRLIIADDHTLLAEACKSLLEHEFQVVAIVNNGRELLRVAEQLKPDIVILDIAMPQLNGLDAGEQLKKKLPNCKLVFMTMNLAPDVAAEAFRRGASGYVVKNATAAELVTAVRRALRSESFLSPLITKETVEYLLRKDNSSSGETRLTPRQSEILQLLVEGMSMKEIASVLNVKPGTVAFHKYHLMRTLGLTTNAALLQYAIKHHLIS